MRIFILVSSNERLRFPAASGMFFNRLVEKRALLAPTGYLKEKANCLFCRTINSSLAASIRALEGAA